MLHLELEHGRFILGWMSILCVIALVSVGMALKNTLLIPEASLDLALRRSAAVHLMHQQNPYTTILPTTHAPANESYAPSVICMILPLATVSFATAKTLWMILNLCATGLILGLFSWQYHTDKKNPLRFKNLFLIASFLFLASTPWRVAMANGQFTLIALSATLVAIVLSEKNKDVLAGIALSIAMIKYPLTGLIPLVFLFKKRWLSVGIMLTIHSLLTLVSGYWLSENPVQLLWQSVATNNTNVPLGLADLGVFLGKFPLTYVVVACMLVAVFIRYLSQRSTTSMLPLCSVAFLLTLLLSYHRIYDFLVLIIPLMLALHRPTWSLVHWLWILFILFVFFGERIALSVPTAYMSLQWILISIGLLLFALECLSPRQRTISL